MSSKYRFFFFIAAAFLKFYGYTLKRHLRKIKKLNIIYTEYEVSVLKNLSKYGILYAGYKNLPLFHIWFNGNECKFIKMEYA